MAYTNIDDPSAHFQVTLYTGDGNDNRQVTNDGNSDLKPDWVWYKDRTQGESHAAFDSTRGATKRLQPNNSNDESTETATLKSFTTDGFTVGTSSSVNNGSNPDQYVAWQWKANGGTTSSNSDGDITSTVQANTTAGFSIMTYSGTTGDVHTIGHGLGVTPEVWIVKQRSGNSEFKDWFFWHKDMAASNIVDNRMMFLNSAANPATYTGINALTTSTIRVKSSTTAQNGDTFVAYAFSQKQGYSRFGKYIGSGDANGPFVYCGFKPAWIMLKITSGTTAGWYIWDIKRETVNPNNQYLNAVEADAEQSSSTFDIDFLSNGFKLRNSNAGLNGSGTSYIYMAFAQNPFVTSGGAPATARALTG
tara:strand:+ start:191 stop:1276 length:1086 start_codon:yes stop_codon:yes gene_type:complete